jgi:putative colanic acid biosynthesis acetyltransferase WcaF
MNATLTDSTPVTVDASKCVSTHSRSNQAARLLWGAAWLLLFRPSPRFLYGWRRFLLRLFGARIGCEAHIYPSVRIWAPWNLEVGEFSALGHAVDCYCVDRVQIGSHVGISQYSYLCTASHDISDPHLGLTHAPIVIGEAAWVAADVFVGPGVHIGAGAVVGARSSVFKDVEPWTVVCGSPARFLKKRELVSMPQASRTPTH